jgi:hypothetical protein
MLAGGTVADDSRVAVEQLPASLPEALRSVVRRATARKPEDRWPSVDAFASALAEVDLRAYPPPVRLAPEARLRAGFDWCTGATATQNLTHEIQRGQYRLEDLERAGVLSPAACEAFREATGYADVTWSAYVNRLRIGEVTSGASFARASDLVVLLHGMFCAGSVWEPVAAAICRDHAQAIVLAPDLYGYGTSRYDLDREQQKHVTPDGVSKSIVAWLELLGRRSSSGRAPPIASSCERTRRPSARRRTSRASPRCSRAASGTFPTFRPSRPAPSTRWPPSSRARRRS